MFAGLKLESNQGAFLDVKRRAERLGRLKAEMFKRQTMLRDEIIVDHAIEDQNRLQR